jgi:type IV pilus assembly protein PilA
MPIVALVCSVIGFCFPPLLLVGIVLGIVCLVQAKGSQGPAIAAVVLPVVAIPIVGILAAIAIPNFIKFQSRSKQSEAKMNLKMAFTAEKSYFAEKDTFTLHPSDMGFSPERGNRYAYAFAFKGPIEPNTGMISKESVGVGIDTAKYKDASTEKSLERIPPELGEMIGMSGNCPADCSITIVAAGNIDNDDTIDVWSVSTAERPGKPAGVPFNDVNDITD